MQQIATAATETPDEIITRHGERIRLLASRFPASLGGDLYQIGCMALLHEAKKWRHEAALWSYARRAVLTAMVAWATNEAKHAVVGAHSSSTSEAVAETPSPADVLAAIEALGAVSTKDREVVLLRIRDGFSFEEIAEATGRTLISTWRTYQRALAAMAQAAGVES